MTGLDAQARPQPQGHGLSPVKVSCTSLEASLTAHLGANIARRTMSELTDCEGGYAALTDAAEALVAALFGREVVAAPLQSVVLSADGVAPALAPDVSAAHPLLGPWTAPTPAAFAAAAMISGATLAYLAPSTPVFEALDVIRSGEAWRASGVLVFAHATAEASAELLYGDVLPSRGVSTTLRIAGDTLFEIGADARSGAHLVRSDAGWGHVIEVIAAGAEAATAVKH